MIVLLIAGAKFLARSVRGPCETRRRRRSATACRGSGTGSFARSRSGLLRSAEICARAGSAGIAPALEQHDPNNPRCEMVRGRVAVSALPCWVGGVRLMGIGHHLIACCCGGSVMSCAWIADGGGQAAAFTDAVSVSLKRVLSSKDHAMQIVLRGVVAASQQTVGVRVCRSLFGSYTSRRARPRVRLVHSFKKRLT